MENKEAKLYTKSGDKGLTSLLPGSQVSKADERVDAMGSVEETVASLGFVRAATTCPIFRGKLERIMKTLSTLRSGLADPRGGKYVFSAEEITFLESDMDKMLSRLGDAELDTALSGGCEQSSRLDMARTVARRCERALIAMDRRYAVPATFKQYINRLGDYLLVAARYADKLDSEKPAVAPTAAPITAPVAPAPAPNPTADAIYAEVLARLGGGLDLEKAKRLIEAVEQKSVEMGKRSVIAVVNAEGNPIAVHVMDGAFLVSYDVAVKKAYTAVAVKMPTIELAKLCEPGQTFYGLQHHDRMSILGGGMPLYVGGTVVGGLAVSGATGEEDHALCAYGASIFASL